jgi:hypothetical protein
MRVYLPPCLQCSFIVWCFDTKASCLCLALVMDSVNMDGCEKKYHRFGAQCECKNQEIEVAGNHFITKSSENSLI